MFTRLAFSAQVQWLKDGYVLKESTNIKIVGTDLHLDKLQMENIGRYTCLATNIRGTATLNYTVTVKGQYWILSGDNHLSTPSFTSID